MSRKASKSHTDGWNDGWRLQTTMPVFRHLDTEPNIDIFP
ncbi:hypothetical protein KNP414_00391 [Paenibacillus mucilaginosus KNP414]|uniref:Uncharacterized protein n=1 Tax=Paenibacillus mucilaginosus (strain KNP414) TaxID=1036673 RepID=F8FNH9_PAEMK|nr:hypothetical protein KNP414_00391 [Paenibacillus mucilaginosus KNP414]